MKKFLVVLLACAMIFGFASTAFAADEQMAEFSDIQDQSQAAINAIMKLAVLGVLEGDGGIGGAYRPNDTITRAEFAKIVCYLTDSVKLASSLETVSSKFPDVQVGQWYTGFVNAAVQAGYFQGDPSGNFRPNAEITMNEVSTVCLRVAGYTDKLPGAWPGNYLTKATNIGILNDVTFVGSQAATRADAAIICDAVLEINMVVHISNDIALAMGISAGTVDKDGFAEVYYMSNEEKGVRQDDGEKKAENILHKAFACYGDSRATFALGEDYDEITAWDFVDFSAGELEVIFAGTDDSMELAEKYYINKGFTLPELAGMEGKIIYNDDNELLFVNVRGSYVYATSVYNDNNRVSADKTYRMNDRMADMYGESTIYEPTGDFMGSDSDNSFPAKVYLDKDGLAVAVKDYNAYNGMEFGIFSEIEEGNVAYKNDSDVGSDLDIDVEGDDYVILKDNVSIDAEDLVENDVLYFLGELSGVSVYVAYSPIEGSLSAQTDSKFTIGGSSYKPNPVLFYVSEDEGDSFKEFAIATDELDKSNFADAAYVKDYNFARLAYISSSADAGVKIIGVVTGTSSTLRHVDNTEVYDVYNGITIYNAEGKEVDYTFHSDFKEDYNDAFDGENNDETAFVADSVGEGANASEIAKLVAQKGFKKGDIVELRLDNSDKIKRLENITTFDVSRTFGDTADAKVASGTSRITFGGKTYTVDKDATIFDITAVKDGTKVKYDAVGLKSVSSLLAADFEAHQVVAFDTNDRLGTVATVLYVVTEGSANEVGIISAQSQGSSGRVYTLDGTAGVAGSERLSGSKVPPILTIYNIVDGDVEVGTVLANEVGFSMGLSAINTAISGMDYVAYEGEVTDTLNGRIEVEDADVFYTADAYIYNMTDGEEITTIRDLRGMYVLVIADDDDALWVAAWDEAPVGSGSYVPSDAEVLAAALDALEDEDVEDGAALELPWTEALEGQSGAGLVAAIKDYIEDVIDNDDIEVSVEHNAGDGFTVTLTIGEEDPVEIDITVTVGADPAAGAKALLEDIMNVLSAYTTYSGSASDTVDNLIDDVETAFNSVTTTDYTVVVTVDGMGGSDTLVHGEDYTVIITVTEDGVPANTASDSIEVEADLS